MKVSVESLQSALANEYSPLVPQLLEGIGRDSIEEYLRECQGPSATEASVQTARMNLIGGLRAAGFIVTGGRSGGDLYQVIGWEEKVPSVPASQWEGKVLSIFSEFNEYFPLKEDDEAGVREYLNQRVDWSHQNSWLYLWCYELAGSVGVPLGTSDEGVIVIRRFVERPRFKIFELHASPGLLLAYAEKYSKASCAPVQILNIRPESVAEFNKLHPQGTWSKREEAVYSVDDILGNMESYFNKRGLTQIKARFKDTMFTERMPIPHQQTVVKLWKAYNEKKHRQLAINRDFKAIEAQSDQKLVYGGYREDQYKPGELVPVAHHLFDRGPFPNMVHLINEKSLNYSKIPGGKPGVSDWNLLSSCLMLQKLGIQYIQSGSIQGGGDGLPDKKKKFANQTTHSLLFTTGFEISEYA